MVKKYLGMLTLLLALLCLVAVSPAGAAPVEGQQVYIMVVDTLSILDINEKDTPGLNSLAAQGSLGLASNRTLRSPNTFDSSLTIGAGNLARAYSGGIMAFDSGEIVPGRQQTAARLYKNLTGLEPGQSASLLLNLPEIIINMQKDPVNTMPGAMGEALRRNNLKVCVLGNGDVNEQLFRASVAIGMDASGRVPLGDVGPRTYRESSIGYLSQETNYDYLRAQVKKYRNQADVIIIELSDLSRMDNADMAFPSISQRQRQLYLAQIDQFIEQIKNQLDFSHDLLLVISPSPSAEQAMNKNTFTPVIAWGKGFEKGILTSGSTRRDFVVASTDIAPSVLNFMGIADETMTMIGQPITSKPAQDIDTLQAASTLSISGATVNRLRVPLVKGYVILQIIIIILGLLAIFWIPRLVRVAKPLILSLAVIPLVFLPLGKFNWLYDWEYIAAAILAIILVTTIPVYLFRLDVFKVFFGLCAITAIALNIDLFTGSSMIQSSVLGYDAMTGARYYGIGNEYMGILLGSMVIFSAAIYGKLKKRWLLCLISLVLLGECYVIASPSLGAQSDGVLTAPAAFLVTIALLSNIKINPRVLISIAIIVVLSVLGLTIYDMNQPLELQSHIGRAANQIIAGGWQEGITIAARKLGMNAKLIRYTIWSRVFLVMLVVLALLVYRPVGAMKKLRQQYPQLVKGFAGIITAALVALVINDSGIVAAATISIYLVVPLLLLMLDVQKQADWN